MAIERHRLASLKQDVKQPDWEFPCGEHWWSAFTLHIITCQKKWVPFGTCLRRPYLPWFGFQCITAAEEKYRAWKRLKYNRSGRNIQLHKSACRKMADTAAWVKSKWKENYSTNFTSSQPVVEHHKSTSFKIILSCSQFILLAKWMPINLTTKCLSFHYTVSVIKLY